MYLTQDWAATDDADWGVAIEVIDDATDQPMDISSAAITFALSIKDDCGSVVLSASTAAGTITKPDDTSIQWLFTAAQMGGLDVGTYTVGINMTTVEGTQPLIVGSLAVIDGGF